MGIDLKWNLERWPDECTRLLSASPAVIYACGPGPDYPTTFISENVVAQLGYQPEEFYERPFFWTERIHPDDVGRVLDELSRIDQGEPLSYEYRFRHKDGHYLWLHDELTPLKDAQGNVVGLVGSWFDITERRQAEEAVRREQELLQLLMDNIPDNIYFKDRESRFTRVNSALAHFLGLGHPDKLVGKRDADFYPKEAAERFYADEQRILETGEPIVAKVEQANLENAAEARWFSTTKVPIRDAAGDIVGIVGASRDITERKQAEEALRKAHDELERRVAERTAELAQANKALQESRDRLRSLVETTSDWIWEVDRSHRYTYASSKVRELLGYEPEDVIGRTPFEFMSAEETERVRAAFQDITASRRPFQGLENVNLHRDGHPVVLETSGVPILGADGGLLGYRGIDRDITARKRAEEALRASEQRFRALFENTPIGIYRTTPDGRIVDANPALVRMLGFSSLEELAQRNLEEDGFEPQYARAEFRERIEREGSVTLSETAWKKRDGSVILVRENAQVTRDADGRVAYYDGTVEDVTERKRAEEALRESEHRYRAIVEDQTELICRWLPGHTHTFVNEAYCRCFGKSHEELIGRSFMPLIPKEDHPKALEHFASLCRENPVASHEHRVIGAGGEIRWHQWADRVIFDEHGDIVEYQSVGRDITERRQAEEALRESERRSRAILDHTFQFIGLMSLDGVVIEANRAALDFAGIEESDVLGKPFWETPWWTHSSELQDRLRDAVSQAAAGHFVRFEATHPAADGTIHSVDFSLKPVKDKAGNVSLLIPEGRDITERKRAEEALRESEELFRTVVDASKDAMVAINRDGLVTIFNPAAEEMFGRKTEEVTGQPLDCLMPTERRAPHRQYVEQYFTVGAPNNAIGQTLELPAMRKNGTVFPVELSLSAGQRGDEPFVLAVIRDITKRKRAEETIRRQALVFDNMHDGVLVVDPQGRITDWNPGAQRIFGYTRAEILGKSPEVLNQPDEAASLTRSISAAITRDRRWSGKVRFVRADGSEGVCEVVCVPLCDEDGRVMGRVSVNRDITARLRAEEEVRRRQEELAHVTRLATMGEMATGLAHELNQPLSAILYYSRGCERRLQAGGCDFDEILGITKKVAVQAERAATFIDRLRAFVRKGGLRLAWIDLNQAVREAVGFAEHEVREGGVDVGLELGTPLRPALADIIQIEQVILNLLRNGIEAMHQTKPGTRRLTLRTSEAGSDAVTVAVADNGCGCSKEVADRLFDAFFTTKPDGMGMGLAISRSIIEAHGGRLWATPNPGGGTTFRFTLPVSSKGTRS